MIVKCFADTNILLYSVSNNPADAAKSKRARTLLASESVAISGQVLQEFVAAALSKKHLGIPAESLKPLVESLSHVPTVPITRELVQEALRLRTRHQLSYWDAAILAAAQELHCEVLYSEDFNHGQIYDSVKAINPFA